MTLPLTPLLGILALSIAGATVLAQAPPANQTPAAPDFRVEIWGSALIEFSARMDAYAQLRESLSTGIPRLAVTDDPVEILKAETALADRIRKARAGAKRGDIFSSQIRRAFRRGLSSELNNGICAAIGEDNPGEFHFAVNGTYPKQRALSTMPPSILAAMPKLPDDVMYRFLKGDLILHDTRANIILDRIDDAIKCRRPSP